MSTTLTKALSLVHRPKCSKCGKQKDRSELRILDELKYFETKKGYGWSISYICKECERRI